MAFNAAFLFLVVDEVANFIAADLTRVVLDVVRFLAVLRFAVVRFFAVDLLLTWKKR